MKPPIAITDKRFVYIPSHMTSVAKTFARVKREREAAAALERAGIPTIGKRAAK